MFENPRRGRQARNFTPNVPKILVLKSSFEQIFSRKLPLGAPVLACIEAVVTDCIAVGVKSVTLFSYGDKILQCNDVSRHYFSIYLNKNVLN